MACSCGSTNYGNNKTSSSDSGPSSSSSDDTDTGDAPALKRPRYACTFHVDARFPWAKVSKKGPTFAYCTVCSRDISVAYGGTKDLHKHENRAVHSSGSQSVANTSSITSYFKQPGPKRIESVIEAEVKFGYFVAEHYLAFNIADHCSKFFPSLFHDSAIAKAFRCGRTKATAIVKVLAGEVMKEIMGRITFFSLHTDETTDITVYQQCALMLRFFDEVQGCVRCTFFKLQPIQKADAESLFKAIDGNFSSSAPIGYSSLVGLGSDGANVMLGNRNSVLSRLKAKQPGLISFHCNCHLAALIGNHASKALPDFLEEVTIQVWYFFQKSPKRYRVFEEFQVFVESKPHKLLKAGQTRWLSLEMCVNRLLEQYDALLSFFRSSAEERLASVQRITSTLENPLTKPYLMFLSNALQVINAFNKLMQGEAPTVHFLLREVQGFVKKLLLRFMVPTVIQEQNLTHIELDDASLHLPVEEVFVGDKARRYIEGDNELSSSEKRAFYKVCREFWITAAKYAVKKLPLDSAFLANLSWVNPGVQEYGMLTQLKNTLQHLPQVIKEEERGAVEEEFLDYCTNEDVKALCSTACKIDVYWHKVAQLKDLTGELRFPLLARLAKAVLIVPHGNADVERSFSKLGLNKTKLRNSLGTDTLNALLQLQCNVHDTCYAFKPTPEMISLCKNALVS